jgi:hypothetical protein
MSEDDHGQRTCPVCQSKPMAPCTVPTSNGRKEVKWFHLDREFDHTDFDEE